MQIDSVAPRSVKCRELISKMLDAIEVGKGTNDLMATRDLFNSEAAAAAKTHDSEVDIEAALMANLAKNGVPGYQRWSDKFRRDNVGGATDGYEGLNNEQKKIFRKQWMDQQLKQCR